MFRCVSAACAALAVLLATTIAPRGAGAAGADALFEPFEAGLLAPAERRIVQAALAVQSLYLGPIDGTWNAAAEEAIAAYAETESAEPPMALHAALLALDLAAEFEAGDWQFLDLPDLGLSFAFPAALMLPPVDEDGHTRWWSAAGDLGILAGRTDEAAMRDWHAAGRRLNAYPDALATLSEPDRRVTSGELADGRLFLSRSDRIDGGWSTVYLVADPAAVGRLDLIAGSIAAGPPADWAMPDPGWLASAMALAADTLEEGPAAAAMTRQPQPAGIDGWSSTPSAGDWNVTGTGFFVNRTDLVTAWHVVASCRETTLGDGTPLALVAADPERDLAVLAAETPASAWLDLGASTAPRLGQPVQALGFPYYALTGTGLNLTTGVVSALAGLDDDRRFVALSAPIQPGNSGGPVLGEDGAVLGVVVARLSEQFIADATGSLPQNINYAVTADELAALLDAHGRPHTAPTGGQDLAEGLPDPVAAAVAPVICW